LEARFQIIQKGLRDQRAATNREYSLVLHSRRRLMAAMKNLRTEIESE
jgi:hypothetical protein